MVFVFSVKQAALASCVSWNLSRRMVYSYASGAELLAIGTPSWYGSPVWDGLDLRVRRKIASQSCQKEMPLAVG